MPKASTMQKKNKSSVYRAKNGAAYAEGRQAYKRGYPNETNPYPPASGANAERIDWFNGWYYERYEELFARLDAMRNKSE